MNGVRMNGVRPIEASYSSFSRLCLLPRRVRLETHGRAAFGWVCRPGVHVRLPWTLLRVVDDRDDPVRVRLRATDGGRASVVDEGARSDSPRAHLGRTPTATEKQGERHRSRDYAPAKIHSPSPVSRAAAATARFNGQIQMSVTLCQAVGRRLGLDGEAPPSAKRLSAKPHGRMPSGAPRRDPGAHPRTLCGPTG